MRMQINVSKSAIMAIRVDARTPQVEWKDYKGIPIVTEYKYLGLTI